MEISTLPIQNFAAVLAYDGTAYSGSQRQGSQRTVQLTLETALRRIGWQGLAIKAAGRTDAGVHATGQVVTFELNWPHPLEKLRLALNANLPPDVVVRRVTPVSPNFDPRRSASSRRYRYRLLFDEVRSPLGERYAWRIWPALDPERLQQTAQLLVGRHDFSAFGTPPRVGGSTVRTVFQARWSVAQAGLTFEVEADAFLYHMVRRMVFFQVHAVQNWAGQETLTELAAYLTPQTERDQALPVRVQGIAPAHGLTLVEVKYPAAADFEMEPMEH